MKEQGTGELKPLTISKRGLMRKCDENASQFATVGDSEAVRSLGETEESR